jgi:hypothetical protein
MSHCTQLTMYKFFCFKFELKKKKTKADLYMPCKAMAHSTKSHQIRKYQTYGPQESLIPEVLHRQELVATNSFQQRQNEWVSDMTTGIWQRIFWEKVTELIGWLNGTGVNIGNDRLESMGQFGTNEYSLWTYLDVGDSMISHRYG